MARLLPVLRNMRIRTRTTRLAVLVAALPLLGACAHVALQQPYDPVEEARVLLSYLTALEGAPSQCAAEKVDQAWALTALRRSGAEEPARARGGNQAWRNLRAGQANLSQASAATSGAWENQQSAAQAQRRASPTRGFGATGPCARSTATWRRGEHGRAQRARGEGSPSDDAWAAARYASVCTEYFDTDHVEARNQLLDWLTSRSMDNHDVLTDYHQRSPPRCETPAAEEAGARGRRIAIRRPRPPRSEVGDHGEDGARGERVPAFLLGHLQVECAPHAVRNRSQRALNLSATQRAGQRPTHLPPLRPPFMPSAHSSTEAGQIPSRPH